MSGVSEKTVEFWSQNLAITEAGNNRPLNFWDLGSALATQQAIPFPDAPGIDLPAAQALREFAPGRIMERGVSIGAGSGHKELVMVRSGLVKHMTLVEVVPDLIEAGRKNFADAGLLDRVRFHCGDYEEVLREQSFDLIYFDNALHHMAAVDSLIGTIASVLEDGGIFLMDDFVGPTYNQFSNAIYDYADHIRALLPGTWFESGSVPPLARLTVQDFLDSDPSEACDSAEILPAIAKWMSGAKIVPTGGLVYYLACREIFQFLRAEMENDKAMIRLLFELDKVLVRSNPDLTFYALAFWHKAAGSKPLPLWTADWRANIAWPNWRMPA